MSRVAIPEDTGDFRLLSRRAVDAIKQLREQHRFMKGLFAWIGYPQKAVPYRRAGRFAGSTKWNYWKLWNFALEGITSFTCGPLKIAHLCRPGQRHRRLRVRRLFRRAHPIYGNPVPVIPRDRDRPLPRGHTAARHRHHRRIPRAHVRRKQEPAAVFAQDAPRRAGVPACRAGGAGRSSSRTNARRGNPRGASVRGRGARLGPQRKALEGLDRDVGIHETRGRPRCLAVLDREDVYPVAVEVLAGLPGRPSAVAQHDDLVARGDEFPGRELADGL